MDSILERLGCLEKENADRRMRVETENSELRLQVEKGKAVISELLDRVEALESCTEGSKDEPTQDN